MINLYSLFRPVLFLLPAETAHGLTLFMLDVLEKTGLLRLFVPGRREFPVNVMGIDFPNPVGLAAGLDKNGDHIESLCQCGFGFIEIGTVTPQPQPGNQKPRLFRLPSEKALINRMGFNNKGVEHLVRQVKKSRRLCVLGINIGKNRNTPLEQAVDDYVSAFNSVYEYADYIAINISSPNTPGLRNLQHGEHLDNLLATLKHEQKTRVDQGARYVPLVVKIAPDMTEAEIRSLTETLLKHRVDGIIATNTTNDHSSIAVSHADVQGGLSGLPLLQRSDNVIRLLSSLLQGRLPIIAVGGIMSAEHALHKMELGASLVQIYTGLIYSGPALVESCVDMVARIRT